MEGLGLTGTSECCFYSKDALVIDAGPMGLSVGLVLKVSEEPPEGKKYLRSPTLKGEDVSRVAALTVRRELQRKLDLLTDWDEVHEVTVGLKMPPNRRFSSGGCSYQSIKQLLNWIVWNVGGLDINARCVNG